MKKLNRIAFVSFIFVLIFVSSSTAQVDGLQEMTMVIPAQSLPKVIEPLLPYKIDLGKNFLGSFYIQSIKNIRIKEDKILFSSLISGKDIKYATQIGKQVVNFVVGDVSLPNEWEVSFKFDKTNKKLLVRPKLQDLKNAEDFSQGDALLNTLLKALGAIEYPIDLKNLKPVKTELYSQLLKVNTEVADIYTGNGKLFIEIIPTVLINNLNEQYKK